MRHSNVDLAVIATASIALCATVFEPVPGTLTAVLGVGLFAASGYVWSEVILRGRMLTPARVVVAAGLALMVPVLGGLVLSALQIPLHRPTWTGLMAVVTLLGSLVLLHQRRPVTLMRTRQRRPGTQVLPFGAAALIGAAAVMIAITSAASQKYPGFTALWLSGKGPNTLTLGVTNHQGALTRYDVTLLRENRVSAEWKLTLRDGQSWHRLVKLIGHHPLTADLYRLPDLSHPYRQVFTGAGTDGS